MSAAPHWPELPYFEKICRSMLDSYMEMEGFTQISFTRKFVGVAYSNGTVVVDLSYDIRDVPPFVMVGLTVIQGTTSYNRDGGIGLWYGIPKEKQERWSFRNESELSTMIEHIRDEIFPLYAERLWREPELLNQLINRFHSERDAKIESEEVERKRRKAETAFKSGDFFGSYQNLFRVLFCRSHGHRPEAN